MEPEKKKGKTREYIESLLVALLIAFFVRSFGIEAFKIPSGSMIPTLMIGDHIFVNKFTYGLRVPFTKKKIAHFRDPERGEAIVFIYPIDEGKDFIKRVIGLPGDRIRLIGDAVTVNGRPLPRTVLKTEPGQDPDTSRIQLMRDANANQTSVAAIPYFSGWEEFVFSLEQVGEVRHLLQYDSYQGDEDREIIVPENHLFVMGDNRDNSSDSRDWGFVPLENVKGKAMFVWLSIDFDRKNLRWDRFGKWIR